MIDISLVIIVISALAGLGVGSFINVVVLRLYSRENITGRSHCVDCETTLRWVDLVPVVSYVLLRGRCRYCGKDIAGQYPLVEAVTATVFVLLAVWFWADPLRLTIYALYSSMLIVIFVYDLKYYLIPDIVSIPAVIVGIIGSLLLHVSWQSIVIGITIGGGLFLVQFILSRGKWVGGGDIRLGAAMGAMLGWPMIGVALFGAYVLGACVAIPMLVARRKGMKDALPFGTFLSVATVLTLLIGQPILHWYLYELIRL